jgi:hypothetical protein
MFNSTANVVRIAHCNLPVCYNRQLPSPLSCNAGKLLGEGACSQVYEAFLDSGSTGDAADRSYVAKVAKLPAPVAHKKGAKRSTQQINADVLNAEHMLYRNFLSGHPQIPALPRNGGFGDDKASSLRFMIIQVMTEYVNSASSSIHKADAVLQTTMNDFIC